MGDHRADPPERSRPFKAARILGLAVLVATMVIAFALVVVVIVAIGGTM